MTTRNMYGVVLWSDMDAQKAVIWCEDQGELAFYTPGEKSMHDAPALDAGDLIQFDLTVQRNMRKATNPQLLQQSHSPDLPNSLRETTARTAQSPGDDKIVDLTRYFGPVMPEPLLRSG